MPIAGKAFLVVIAIGAAFGAFIMTSDDFGRPEKPDRRSLRAPVIWEPPLGDPHRAQFSICTGPVRSNCVVHGDTFWFEGTKIRIADIDAPEISAPVCADEAQAGKLARARLLDLLNAGAFRLIAGWGDEDRFGRKLRIVARDDVSLGDAGARRSGTPLGRAANCVVRLTTLPERRMMAIARPASPEQQP